MRRNTGHWEVFELTPGSAPSIRSYVESRGGFTSEKSARAQADRNAGNSPGKRYIVAFIGPPDSKDHPAFAIIADFYEAPHA